MVDMSDAARRGARLGAKVEKSFGAFSTSGESLLPSWQGSKASRACGPVGHTIHWKRANPDDPVLSTAEAGICCDVALQNTPTALN